MILRAAIALSLLLALPGAARAAEAAPAAEKPAEASGPQEAQPRSVSAVATPDKVRLGEAFELTIEIRDVPEVRYELPAGLSLGGPFEIVKATPSRATKDGVTTTRFVLQAVLFELGEQTASDVVLDAVGPAGNLKLTVLGPKVTGVGVLKEDDESGLHEILPPVEALVPRYTALWIIGATLLATLAALLLWRWLKGRPKRVAVAPPPPRRPAHERALEALAALQREDLPAQSRPKEFHFRLSEILRDYLGERFGFQALDMTTEELLATLQRTSTPGLTYAAFEAWCRDGDLVKFAKLQPTPAACKQSIEDAFGFVRATMPRAAASDPREAAS